MVNYLIRDEKTLYTARVLMINFGMVTVSISMRNNKNFK